MEILTFILISIGIIIVPGPNVLVIVSTSLAHGKTRGLQTVAGTSSAMLIQLSVAAFGTSWFVNSLASGFIWLKWIGVCYLIYLGIKHILAIGPHEENKITAGGSFQRGFWVSLTNPKTILFFSAFLPQFTLASAPYLPQIVMLSAIFLILAVILDSGYVLLSNKLTSLLRNQSLANYRHGISGTLYLGAGATLASVKNA